MRILILANSDMGLYKFRRELIEELVKKHVVFFCVPNGKFVESIINLGCTFIPCNVLDRRSTNPIKELKLFSFYKRSLKVIHPDIVFTYTIKPNVYGGWLCGRMGIPYLVNVTGLGTTIENKGLLETVSTTLYRFGLKKAQCVFFQNKTNLKFFIDKGIVNGRTRLIPGSGVNLHMYNYESYPNDNDCIRFLFVGRIMRDKGIDELLTAIRDIRRTNKKVVLDVVGFCDDNYSSALSKAEKEGLIVNHGLQANVQPFYKACHCVILPSYHEGMANVLLEASSSGRPIIATRVPGCIETFDEGVTGFGCEVKSVESLKKAMKKFLDISQKKREEMGFQARAKMEQEFDRRIVLNAYFDELSEISRQG